MTAPARAREADAPRRRRPDTQTPTAHQKFIRSLPCVACGKPAPSECANVVGALGLGVSQDDRYLVPLCGPVTVWNDCCHNRVHYLGPRRFWSELGIDPLDLARRLWRLSGDRRAGTCAVMLTRRQIADGAGRLERRA